MIKTGGGRFNPENRNLFFLAGSGAAQTFRKHYLVAVNDVPDIGSEETQLAAPIRNGSVTFLDSGIFNLTNEHKRATGCTMDEALALAPEQIAGFDALYSRYVELSRRYENDLWGYIELDQGGVENKRRTRARLEAEGLRPIPVYHPLNDGWDYFDELAEGYDRICFGNIVQASTSTRIRLLNTMWERRRRYPHLWIHVLGLTVNEHSAAIPSDSCDSSAWLGGLRWGRQDGGHIHLKSFGCSDFGELSRDFVYERGSEFDSDTGIGKAERLCLAMGEERTTIWRDILNDRAALGFAPWPTVDEREPVLQPGTRSTG